jgi:hypothetical protein
MSFLPDLTPLTHKINEFTQTQNQNQAQMITLLKQICLELNQIRQELKNK